LYSHCVRIVFALRAIVAAFGRLAELQALPAKNPPWQVCQLQLYGSRRQPVA
jgi:hypothetical protein